MYDVIVVGGGSAGAAVAWGLARRGRDVLLVDHGRPACDGPAVCDLGPEGRWLLAEWGLARAGGPARTLPRAALDELLVRAAEDAGATVRGDFSVTDAVWEDGRVVGIVGHHVGRHVDHGRSVVERAGLVVGADGRASLVAKAVGAGSYEVRPAASCSYTACWAGSIADADRPEVHFLDGRAVSVLPAGDGWAAVTVWLPVREWAGFKRRPEETYRAEIERFPALAARLATAVRQTRFSGGADRATGFRRAGGPGWVLVGPAGHQAEPFVGRGTEANLISAALLVEGGPSRYAARRDRRLGPAHRLACAIGSFRWGVADVPRLLQELETARNFRPLHGRAVNCHAFQYVEAG